MLNMEISSKERSEIFLNKDDMGKNWKRETGKEESLQNCGEKKEPRKNVQ